MKIKFLGTSHGTPMKNRACQSMLIEAGDNIYLVDAGAPVLNWLIDCEYAPERLKSVFITHFHSDHIIGLCHLIVDASWVSYLKDMKFGVHIPDETGIDVIKTFCSALEKPSDNITYSVVKSGEIYNDGTLKVTAVHTDHLDFSTDKAYGFMLEAEGKKVYITGDMHESLKDFPDQLLSEPLDLIVSECAHCSAENLMEKLSNVKAKRAMVVHVYPTEKYDIMKKLESTVPMEVLYPDDGDEYEI